jgi:hypothetical protein
MRPIRDLTRAVTMPLQALFVVGLCALINWMTSPGHWWFQWVALGMGIAAIVALARGLRTLLVLLAAYWVGRKVYERYGPAARERFDAWVAAARPKAAEVMGALRTAGQGFGADATRH